MNKYLVVIEKDKEKKRIWSCIEICVDSIEDVSNVISDNPKFYDDCKFWEIISINKEWEIGGSMVDSMGLKAGLALS